jgi:phage-related protein
MKPRKNIVGVSVTTVSGTYKDLADFSYTVEGWVDALSGPARSFTTASVPGRIETVKLAATPAVKPGQFQIVGTVTGDTMAAYLANLRNLKGWAVRAVALKLLALDTTTFVEVDQTEAPVVAVGMPVNLASRVTVTFDVLKPYWQAATATSNAVTTSFTEQPLGTAPVRPVVTFTGAPSGLTLTYADSAGVTVQTLTLAGLTTEGATQTVIDMDAMTVVQTISGVATDAIATLDNATDFFALDPKDADTVTPIWPKLKYALSGGSVSGVTCAYRACYW